MRPLRPGFLLLLLPMVVLAACTQVAQRRIAGEPIADSAVTEAIIAELRAQFRLAGRT